MNKKLIYGIVGALVIIGGGWFLVSNAPKGMFELETATVTRGPISNSVTATGAVEPVTEVEVGTQVSGIIDKLYVDYNDVVKAGQLIAEMDRINLEAELVSAQAQLASSKSEYEYQTKVYARNKILWEKKLISEADYETAEYNYLRSKAAYEQNQASIVRVNRNLEYATITSPIDGVVIDRAVEEGQTVAAGFETPKLYTIAADLTKMQVIADVDEADIGNVKEGQLVTFTVDAYPNDEFSGKVEQIRLGSSSSSSSTTSSSTVVTYEVVISAENPDLKLKPRLTANVNIHTLNKDNVLTIPNKALRFAPNPEVLEDLGYTMAAETPQPAPGKRIAWVIDANKQIQPKMVTTGVVSGSDIEIVEGLSEGDLIAVDLNSLMPVTGSGGFGPGAGGPPPGGGPM